MQTYSFQTFKRRKKFVVIFYLSLLVFFIWLIQGLLTSSSSKIISPLQDEPKTENMPQIMNLKNKPRDTTELLKQLKQLLDNEKGVYSVYIFDLKQGKGFGINETMIFTAASVAKIPILASLYYEAQKGEIDLDERITIQEKDIQDYGTGVIRYEGSGGIYSIKTLAQLMIEKSDNTAAFVLSNIIGAEKIQVLMERWGLIQTNMKDNKTSNKDMALLFSKIYKGEITNEAYTLEMLGYMDETDFENRLPILLPKEVKVYHKIGTEVGNIHDVGIVALEKNPYYIGVMTNDIIDEPTTESVIAQVSKITYDFMTK